MGMGGSRVQSALLEVVKHGTDGGLYPAIPLFLSWLFAPGKQNGKIVAGIFGGSLRMNAGLWDSAPCASSRYLLSALVNLTLAGWAQTSPGARKQEKKHP